jgi:hypothetical protein
VQLIGGLDVWRREVFGVCPVSVCKLESQSAAPGSSGGAGGIAAGFASQQLLLNLVAGVNIFLTRRFIAGDQVWIASWKGEV